MTDIRTVRCGIAAAVISMAVTLGLPDHAAADSTTSIIVPGAVLMPNGELVNDLAVVIRDGRIHAVEPAAEYADHEHAIHRPGTVLSPGLIDAHGLLGAYGSNVERVHAIDPDLSAIDAINPWDETWSRALAAGLTTVMIAPHHNNLVAGMTAVMRTGNDRRPPEPMRDQAMMLMTFGSSALDANRPPTSRAGAIAMLRNALADARAGRGSTQLARVLDGDIEAIVYADSGEDVTAALRFFETYGIGPTIIIHTMNVLDVLDDLAEAPVPVVVGPYTTDMPHQVLVGPAQLDRQGIDLVFAGRTPIYHGTTMRMSAALAVKAGLDPAAARRGLTSHPAAVLGVDDRVGAIALGRDADLVLFSADPLRPDARVLEVYLGGELVVTATDLLDELARLDSDDDPGDLGERSIGGTDDEAE